MNIRPRIYISGPISKGDKNHNLKQSFDAQERLIRAGFSPLNPMLTMLLPCEQFIEHQVWIDVDLPWVAMSDAVLRLPGESAGADQECDYADELGIPIYTKLEELIEKEGCNYVID